MIETPRILDFLLNTQLPLDSHILLQKYINIEKGLENQAELMVQSGFCQQA